MRITREDAVAMLHKGGEIASMAGMTLEEARKAATEGWMKDAVAASDGNVSEAARTTGIHRNTFARYLKEKAQ